MSHRQDVSAPSTPTPSLPPTITTTHLYAQTPTLPTGSGLRLTQESPTSAGTCTIRRARAPFCRMQNHQQLLKTAPRSINFLTFPACLNERDLEGFDPRRHPLQPSLPAVTPSSCIACSRPQFPPATAHSSRVMSSRSAHPWANSRMAHWPTAERAHRTHGHTQGFFRTLDS